MLAQPQETLDLQHPFDKRKSISVLTSAFPKDNTNRFLIGCEDGGVFQCQRHGQKSGITEMFGSGNTGILNSASALAGFTAGGMHNLNSAHSGPVFGLRIFV